MASGDVFIRFDGGAGYGRRGVGAALRHHGFVVNGKTLRRLVREHDLHPKRLRRTVVTKHGDHDDPISADHARDVVLTGPSQLWVMEVAYIMAAVGFVHLSPAMFEDRHAQLTAASAP